MLQMLMHSLNEFKELMGHHPLFSIGMLLVAGYFIGKLAAKIKLPEITGFIIAGLVLGESITGIVPHHMGESLKILTQVALGLIAITIGAEFHWGKLKRLGREVVIITIVQLLATFGMVSIGLYLFALPLPFALLLGAIASATAPAATVAIVQSLRAYGTFVDYLYGVVALDDAGCVMLFGVIFAVASGIIAPNGNTNSMSLIIHACTEVLFSILLGIISGILIHIISRKQNTKEMIITTLGMIFLTIALSLAFHLSPLLTNMAAGTMIINLSARNHRIFRSLEPLSPPIYALFFVIAGTELCPKIIFQKEILFLGLVYIICRALGKYGGVYLGCAICKTEAKIKNYLGFCMLPQAGVAIGLVLLIQASPLVDQLAKTSPAQAKIVENMVNIILFSVFVNELLGPPISKYAIVRGNEMEI